MRREVFCGWGGIFRETSETVWFFIQTPAPAFQEFEFGEGRGQDRVSGDLDLLRGGLGLD